LISVTINGSRCELDQMVTIESYLKSQELTSKYFAVAVNGQVILKNDFNKITLKNDDVIEIVRPVGGG